MKHQEWHKRYASVLTAYVQRPSEDSARRAASLGESLLAAHVAPGEVVTAHMACVEELCATGAHVGTTAWTAATPPLLEVMKVYGRCLQKRRGTPRPLAEQTGQSFQTLAEAKQAQHAAREESSEVRGRLEQRTAELAAANEQLQKEIGERKRAEEVLCESEDRLRLLTDGLPVLISYVDAGQRYRFNNRAYEQWFGVPRGEINGRHIRDVLGGSAYQTIQPHVEAALSGQEVTFEKQVPYRGGGTRYVSAIYVPHLSESRQVKGFYALIMDITERKRAEEALRESESRYRQLFESLNDAALLADIETGRIVETNRQGELLLARPRDEIVGMHQSGLHPPGEADRYRRLFANHIEKGHATDYDAEVIRKDGAIVPVTISASTLSVGGRPLILGLFRHITERKQAEEALRESEEQLRLVTDNVTALIAYVGSDRRYRYVNKQYERLHGLAAEGIIGKHVRDLIGYANYQLIEQHIDAALSGQRVNYEAPIVYADSKTRWISAAYIPHKDSAGSTVGFYALVNDITERKQAEEALQESAARYRQLFATVSDAIIVFDGETKRFVDVNEAAVRLYGYSREEFLRLRQPDITAEPEESRVSIEQTLAGELTRVPLRYHKKKDGTVFPVEIAASVLTLGNRRLLCGVVRDITERKRAEEEARQRQAEMAHVSRLTLVGEMASGLSHDLSQPLSTILFYARGCIRRMRSGTADPTALLDVMEKVAAQAEAAGRIVRRLREFVSKRAPHLSTVDINEAVRRSLSLAQSEISEGKITVRLQAAESLSPVRADRIQIKQVILNLVRNGIEAMRDVEVGQRELTIETSSLAGDTVAVAVHDTGMGLSAEVAERVFDSFFSTKPDGMGMGLSISRSIIEAHGGRLWVAPSPERGATFQFSLPVMRGAADEEA